MGFSNLNISSATGGAGAGRVKFVTLDLDAGATARTLTGKLTGLAGFDVFVEFAVNADGHARMTFTDANGNNVGFCDGSVRQIDRFDGSGASQDMLGSFDGVLLLPAVRQSFHLNLLHDFGGTSWTTSGLPGFASPGSAVGAVFPSRSDSSMPIRGTFSGPGTTSSFVGQLDDGTSNTIIVVCTINKRGSLVMMGGQVMTDPAGNVSLIGLLFTGGVALNGDGRPASGEVVGRKAGGEFGSFLLPAVQKRPDTVGFFFTPSATT
jgi:prepilin-type processing-associated H-X9-DG protein